MENMSWVTSWEKWREAMGHAGSAHRRAVDAFLQTHPAIMYWGDSWFSTPLYLNLARQSAGHINGMGILLGKPGAEAAELFSASNVKSMVARLKNSPFDVLCLSAGGNDCLDDRLAQVFAAWQNTNKAKIEPLPAFEMLKQSGAFDEVFDAYDRLLKALAPVQAKRPHFRVIGHPYVPIHRIGAQADLTTANIGLIAWLKGDVGPWMWNRMQHVLQDQAAGKAFADLILVQGFKNGTLARLADRHGGLFSVADFSNLPGSSQDAFWNDEIHPTESGFLEISRLLNAEIRRRLPPAKAAAVH
ncbi:MAG: hypothetical protein ABWX88_09745 [Pseudoxanthomonas sp.]